MGAWGAKASPPKFYYVLATRKLVEVTRSLKMERARREAGAKVSSRNQQEGLIKILFYVQSR